MGKGTDLYFQQQQARQLRELEKHQAAQSGLPLRKLSWVERNVLGLKDEPDSRSSEPGSNESKWAGEEVESARRRQEQEKPTPQETLQAEEISATAAANEGAPHIHVRGHMIDVTWDGQTLTVVANNKVARMALRGQEHGEGPLELRADEIASTELKQPGAMTNGRLTICTTDEKTYHLHFIRKTNAEFSRLYKALPG